MCGWKPAAPVVCIRFSIVQFFTYDLDEGTGCTLSRFANDNECYHSDCAAIQRDLSRLKIWAEKNIMKFNKSKSSFLEILEIHLDVVPGNAF